MQAQFSKSKDGAWVVRATLNEGELEPRLGSTIAVKKRDGSSKNATVESIVWRSGDGRAILIRPVTKVRNSDRCRRCGREGGFAGHPYLCEDCD